MCVKMNIGSNVYVYSYGVKVDKMTVLAISNLPSIITN